MNTRAQCGCTQVWLYTHSTFQNIIWILKVLSCQNHTTQTKQTPGPQPQEDHDWKHLWNLHNIQPSTRQNEEMTNYYAEGKRSKWRWMLLSVLWLHKIKKKNQQTTKQKQPTETWQVLSKWKKKKKIPTDHLKLNCQVHWLVQRNKMHEKLIVLAQTPLHAWGYEDFVLCFSYFSSTSYWPDSVMERQLSGVGLLQQSHVNTCVSSVCYRRKGTRKPEKHCQNHRVNSPVLEITADYSNP